MANSRSVLSQLLQWVDRDKFQAGVDEYGGDKRARHLKSWSQFVALLFGQLTGHSSLRAITAGLNPHFSPIIYCDGGYAHDYCVSLKKCPQRTYSTSPGIFFASLVFMGISTASLRQLVRNAG